MNDDIEREVAALRQMTTGQVCERYAQLFGVSLSEMFNSGMD
jgi:hypothetical protein